MNLEHDFYGSKIVESGQDDRRIAHEDGTEKHNGLTRAGIVSVEVGETHRHKPRSNTLRSLAESGCILPKHFH